MTSPPVEAELPNINGLRALDLMQRALTRAPGIKVVTNNHRAALRLRRQLYSARRRAREHSDHTLDDLSITVSDCEVKLIVRERNQTAPLAGIEQILPLGRDQVPVSIGSRGSGRLSLQAALTALEMLGGRRP